MTWHYVLQFLLLQSLEARPRAGWRINSCIFGEQGRDDTTGSAQVEMGAVCSI